MFTTSDKSSHHDGVAPGLHRSLILPAGENACTRPDFPGSSHADLGVAQAAGAPSRALCRGIGRTNSEETRWVEAAIERRGQTTHMVPSCSTARMRFATLPGQFCDARTRPVAPPQCRLRELSFALRHSPSLIEPLVAVTSAAYAAARRGTGELAVSPRATSRRPGSDDCPWGARAPSTRSLDQFPKLLRLPHPVTSIRAASLAPQRRGPFSLSPGDYRFVKALTSPMREPRMSKRAAPSVASLWDPPSPRCATCHTECLSRRCRDPEIGASY